jgi:hypothetical protein
VRFDENEDDFDIDLEEDDEIQEVKEVKEVKMKTKRETKRETKSEEEAIDFDILDEIRNDMNITKLPHNEEEVQETILESDDEGEAVPDAVLNHQDVKKLYQELVSVKEQLAWDSKSPASSSASRTTRLGLEESSASLQLNEI